MQIDKKDYQPEKHDVFKALTVKQPYADLLTRVAYIDDECFKVSVIPHTGEETTLLGKKTGDSVNLENDIIGKYVERLLTSDDRKKKNDAFSALLSENGFM